MPPITGLATNSPFLHLLAGDTNLLYKVFTAQRDVGLACTELVAHEIGLACCESVVSGGIRMEMLRILKFEVT
jgi:hypothetical protein